MDASEDYRRIRKDRRAPRPSRPETWVAAYISLRQALGFVTAGTEWALGRFLSFMQGRGITFFDEIDRDVASVWLHSGSPQAGTIADRLKVTKGFFRYLVGQGAVKENVWESFCPPKRKQFIPYIFSLAELQAVLGHVRGKIDPKKPGSYRVRGAHHAMLHTLYACGLRSGEICRLKIGDVDFERSIFTVRETKFGKTRLVPFNPRTRELVSKYLDRFRRCDDGMRPEAPLFLNLRRRAFSQMGLYRQCSHVCAAAGVYRRRETRGKIVYGATNIHAFRHTFAIHRLLKWYEEGADVNAKLPLLATYMGHAHYWDTQQYLTILPRFIDIAGKLFAGKFEGPLKDLE